MTTSTVDVAMRSCGGCGLFFGHVPDCRGFVAVWMHYGRREEQDGFQTPEDAESFLVSGEEYGTLSSVAVLWPDGTVWRERSDDPRTRYDWPEWR